ncbi:sulfotransferase [Parasphingopyxis sp. CP4]|nr:sulfotransferase [Parasphingopyxis sp. CP4]QLC22268.1 sulfotransferase [Parasphingopyxis sp. CP4]
MASGIFITGMARSGTTLLCRLTGGVSETTAFSQPLPLLLVQAMRDFLSFAGIADDRLDYPITDEQFGHAFNHAQFERFVQDHQISREQAGQALNEMKGYSGQKFKPSDPMAALDDWPGGNLAQFVRHYLHFHTAADCRYFTWKEAIAEAFLPHLLAADYRAILIVRDPRDVAASLMSPASLPFTGDPRPLLWIVRHWRKSVAYLHEYAADDRVFILRYEDLVADPDGMMTSIAAWIGTEVPKNSSIDDLLRGWTGNSSQGPVTGISNQLSGRHKTELSGDQRQLIEALCVSEMAALSYANETTLAGSQDIIANSVLLESGTSRPELSYFNFDDRRREEELTRLKMLQSTTEASQSSLFIYNSNLAALRRALGV